MSDSIWKKEISLSRKRKPPAVAEPQPVAAAEPKQSVWKKEISFGRRAAPPVVRQPVVAAEPKQSIWKKEISLSGRRRRRKVERLANAAAQSMSPEFSPEPAIDLNDALALHGAIPGKRAPVAPAEPGAPTVGAASVAAAPADAEPAAVTAAALPPFEPEQQVVEPPPVAPEPVYSQPVEPSPVAPEPVYSQPVEPSPAAPEPVYSPPVSGLSPEVVAASVPPEPPPVPDFVPAVVDLELEPEPADAPAAPLFREPEPWSAAPVMPPETMPPGAVPPPATEPESPAWESSEWGAGGPPDGDPVAAEVEPALEPEPVAEEAGQWGAAPALPPVLSWPVSDLPSAPEPVLEPEPVAALESVPASGPEPAFEPEPAVEPAPEKVSFWKAERSLTGRRRGAAGAAPASPRRSLRRLSLPARRGRHATTRVVGLKIGSSQLAAARISNNGVAELHQLVRQELEPGIVVSGEVRDPEALAAALRRFFTANKLPRKGVRLGVASNRIGVRTVEVVGIESERQLENAIRFRAQEVLPIPPEEAVLDYQVLAASVDDEGRSVKRILLVVAHRDLVERYVHACRRAGVVLAGVDLEAFALLRSLAPPTEPGDSALVAVSIGHDRSTLAVSNGRVCEFTRVLEWGGSAIDAALAPVLACAPSEVEAVKHALSLDGRTAPDGRSVAQVAAALDAVRRELRSFARELVASLQFYQAQPGSLGIGDIVITGGTTQLPGLAAELEQLVGVDVRVGNPLARLKVSKRLEHTERVGSLAVAIGLGIDD